MLTALISGVAVYYNSIAVKGLDPVGFAMAKNLLAALVLAGALLMLGTWKQFAKFTRAQWVQLLGIAVVGGSVPFALFFSGLSMAASPASGSFVYRLLFLFSAVFGIAFLREKLNFKTVAGVGIILAANLVLLLNLSAFSFGLGEALVLAATLMWSAENVLLKKALAWISPDALAAARLGLGGMILLAAMAAWNAAMPGASVGSLASLAALPLLPLLVSALLIVGFTMTYYRGLAGLAVSEATAILTLGGLVSALMPALLGSKLPGSLESVSLVLIALGAGLVLASARSVSAKPTPVLAEA
ncbi:EamA-like transporter family protein [uncultured archaeon]|nr:EamA-like transporter family protein [uncultured archaeon]